MSTDAQKVVLRCGLFLNQGAHRERFDEFGNGRGLAGREYVYVNDGMTESPSRCHEVFSSAIRRRKSGVYSFFVR